MKIKANLNYRFSDCPNGFVHLDNKCYRWLPPDEIDQHLRNCHLFRGNLLEISPANEDSEVVAKTMAQLYPFTSVYAGPVKRFRMRSFIEKFMTVLICFLRKHIPSNQARV